MFKTIGNIILALLSAIFFTSCQDSFRDTYYVYDRHDNNGSVKVFSQMPTLRDSDPAVTQWNGYTVVRFEEKKDIYEREPYIFASNTETSQSGWIRKDCIHIYREDGEWDRSGNFYKNDTADKLDKAGSKYSGFIFRYIDFLQFERCKYDETLWLWLYIGAGLLTVLLAIGLFTTAGDGGPLPSILYFLLWASLIFLFYAQYVEFGIHSPFAPPTVAECSSSDSGNWFVGLITFALLLVAFGVQIVIGPMMLGTLLPGADSMSANAEKVQMNVLCQYFPLIIWGISIWLFKGVADYVLFAMLGGQAIYSVYLLVMGVIRGGFFSTLIYVILFPVALATFLMVALTFGFMIAVLVAIVAGGLSVFTQPVMEETGDEVYTLRDACGIKVDEIDRFGNSTHDYRHYSSGFGGWFRDR